MRFVRISIRDAMSRKFTDATYGIRKYQDFRYYRCGESNVYSSSHSLLYTSASFLVSIYGLVILLCICYLIQWFSDKLLNSSLLSCSLRNVYPKMTNLVSWLILRQKCFHSPRCTVELLILGSRSNSLNPSSIHAVPVQESYWPRPERYSGYSKRLTPHETDSTNK